MTDRAPKHAGSVMMKKILLIVSGVIVLAVFITVSILVFKTARDFEDVSREQKTEEEDRSSREPGKEDQSPREPGKEDQSPQEPEDIKTEKKESETKGGTAEAEGGRLAGDSLYYGPLQVIGTSLCDSEGNPVQLKGISTHGLAWFPDYVNEALFKELHEQWNVNVIRLAMYTGEYGGYCTGGDQGQLKQLIRDGVEYASGQNMYVIIDWHILSERDPNSYK